MNPPLPNLPPLTASEILTPYIGVFILAFGVTFLATPVMRWLAKSNGIVDWPDRKRKLHVEPVPYLGGVAIFLGWIAGMCLCLFLQPGSAADQPSQYVSFPLSIVFGAGVITVIGMIDDVYGISPRVKLGGQLLATAALASEKVGIYLVAESLKTLGMANPPWALCYVLGAIILAFFVLGGCNSVNLMDGLDGLAAGVTAIATLGFLFISVYIAIQTTGYDPELRNLDSLASSTRVVLCLATLGAVLGFLPYNFNPASIFMGDSGSLLLGYLSASTILLFGHTHNKGPFFVMAALIVFAVPITDTALAIVRRKLRGQSISTADRQHLHHQVLHIMKSLGFSPNLSVKLAVLTIYLFALIFAVLGCVTAILRLRYLLAVVLVLLGFLLLALYKAAHKQKLLLEPPTAEPPTHAPSENILP